MKKASLPKYLLRRSLYCLEKWPPHKNTKRSEYFIFFHTLGLLVPLTKYRLSTDKLLKKSIDNFSVKTKLKAPTKNLHESHYTIEPIFADVSHMDPFLTTKSVCQLIEKDVMAVFGVHMGTLDQQIASILSYVGIPFLQINPSFQWENAITKYNSSLNLYPSRKILAQVSCNHSKRAVCKALVC